MAKHWVPRLGRGVPGLFGQTDPSIDALPSEVDIATISAVGFGYEEDTDLIFFCTERRLLWLARPGRKALARQAFLGRGGSPKSSSIAG